MHVLRITLRWGGYSIFTISCVSIALYAFAFLYGEYVSANSFHVRFATAGWSVPLHFFGAGLALLLAPLQASGRIRRYLPRLHRMGGWLYALAVLAGAASGAWLAPGSQGGAASAAGFLLLSVVWVWCTGNGIYYALRGNTQAHRRWMLRSVALTFAAATLRLMLGVGAEWLQLPFTAVYISAAWLSWTINLAVLEIALRWPAAKWCRPGLLFGPDGCAGRHRLERQDA